MCVMDTLPGFKLTCCTVNYKVKSVFKRTPSAQISQSKMEFLHLNYKKKIFVDNFNSKKKTSVYHSYLTVPIQHRLAAIK